MDRLESAKQISDSGLWDWDLSTNRIHFSPGWISMLGCSGGDLANLPEEWFKRVHAEDLDFVLREIKGHISQGSSRFELQHRLRHQDGCYRWMCCRGVITRDQTGRAIRIAGSCVDITAQKVVDPLTGLPNRVLLLDRLTRSLEKARRQQDFLFAVLLVGLDLFDSGISRLETVNTDQLVIAAARRMERFLRAKDSSIREGCTHLVVRSAGEEFIILLDGLSTLSESKMIADGLLKDLLAPFDFEGREVFLSPSIGIALSATGYRNPEAALRDADTALYRAKSFGQSRCEVFDTAVLESTRIRNQLEEDLQGALAGNQFQVFYQPIVSLLTNQIAGFEALIRWNHPFRGCVMPMDFIGIAEKSGFILQLDQWVMQEVCSQLSLWKKNPRISKELWVSINLSATQFMQPSLAEETRRILEGAELDASSIMLEVTEGTVMQNPEAARRLLMQLRVMGARIGLDDFGTGYSSLAHLRQFPLDFLKIDRAFVRSIEKDSDNREIIRAISTLGQQLGLQIIVEGIENPRQLDLLRKFDCRYGQGFLFSRAVPSNTAEELLLEGLESRRNDRKTSPGKHVQRAPDSGSGSSEQPEAKQRWKQKKYVRIGIPALIVLMIAVLAASMRRLPYLSAARNSALPGIGYQKPEIPKPPASNADATQPLNQGKSAVPEAPRSSAPPVRIAPESRDDARKKPSGSPMTLIPQQEGLPAAPTESFVATIPKNTTVPMVPSKAANRAAVEFAVVHEHVLGSCRGVLKFTGKDVSFISDKPKDSFYLEYPAYICTLDNDQLTIKSGSKIFRFKSAAAGDKNENRSQLFEIYQEISKLDPASNKNP